MPLLLKKLIISSLFCTLILPTVTGCNQSDAEKRAGDKTKREQQLAVKKEQLAEKKRQIDAQREEECQLIREAVASINQDGLLGSKEPDKEASVCKKFHKSECDYKVEIMFNLVKLGKNDAFEQIARIGNDCSEDFAFASKYGLDAFQEHSKLLQAAIDGAFERGSEEGSEKCDSRDMEPGDDSDRFDYGRGRR